MYAEDINNMDAPSDDYSRPPRDKPELLERIRREWNALDRAIAGLGEQQMGVPDEGGWSIKDHLAHLAAWEHLMRLQYLQQVPAHDALGVDEATYRTLDEDGINAILQKRNRDRPLEEVLTEHRRSHAEVMADLTGLSFEEMLKPLDANDLRHRLLLSGITGNTYEHYREHRETITKFLGK